MENLKKAMKDVLENNILNYWIHKVKDEENGGFYGRVDGNDQVHPEAEKGAVMNARILWAFSAAYRVLKKPEYLEAATRAKEYVRDHFLDKEYGGASTGAWITRAIRLIPRNRPMPSALPFTDFPSMRVLQVTRKR